ncbi:MAG TPA: hypothetical protein PLZ51_22035, partial [Aggregatilineales bacterium]|nr:hypothetical protein [Aggregatilineales bacterium]
LTDINIAIEVTEECDHTTGINTISFTITGASIITAMLGNSSLPFPYIINGTSGQLALQDGTQTVTVNTSGLYLATLQYLNPEYLNEALKAMLAGGSPNSNMPQLISRNLTLCGT